jgi:hypothetical protein
MLDLAQSRAWVLSGTEFEISLRPKIASLFPEMLVVDGTEGVLFRTLEDDGDHLLIDNHPLIAEDPNRDRHTWLGREPAKIMARKILETLEKIDGAHVDQYRENSEALIRDIDREFDALVEERFENGEDEDDGLYLGRLYCQAPEVDGAAVITSDRNLPPGAFVRGRITGRAGNDLDLRVNDKNSPPVV